MTTEKIALIDVDGVCADFTGGLPSAIRPPLKPQHPTSFDILDLIKERDGRASKKHAEAKLASRLFWGELKPIEGAIEGISRLRELGFDVIFVSAPWLSCETWERTRQNWLADHFHART